MRLLDRFITRELADETALVDDKQRATRLYRRALLAVALVLAATLARLFSEHVVALLLAGVVLGWYAARGALLGVTRAVTYRAGWLAGRRAFVASLDEAARRGMSFDDWLKREAERDAATLLR